MGKKKMVLPADKARAIIASGQKLKVDQMVKLICSNAELMASCGFTACSADFSKYYSDVVDELTAKLEAAGFDVEKRRDDFWVISFMVRK